MSRIPAPLFEDPIYGGPADPTMIRNAQTGKYYLFYTQRRASAATEGSVAYCYGSKIGVAESDDGAYWYYRGALDLEFEFGDNTFWAPEIMMDPSTGLYHMYVTYIRGIHRIWAGDACILHYTSEDLLNWKKMGKTEIESSRVIDSCVYPLPSGGWRMWYKDERSGSHTFYADSTDLYHWEEKGQATFDHGQEGPNVFALGGKYWLICCEGVGLSVYSSDDLTHFTRQDSPRLLSGEGKRKMDNAVGRHADVYVTEGGRAYIVYFVHYYDSAEEENRENRSHAPTALQMAELRVENGRLICDRDAEPDFCEN